MEYDRINLMLPTYKRSDGKLRTFVESALKTASSHHNLAFTFCVNRHDIETQEYLKQRFSGENAPRMIMVFEELEKPHLGKYFNQMYEMHKEKFGESCLVSMLGDDMEFVIPDWDLRILEVANYFDGVIFIYGDDCRRTNQRMATNHFTTMKVIEAQAPFPYMCEEFAIDMIDLIWQQVAERLGMCVYLHDLKIKHNHASLPGNMDDVWRRMRQQLPEVKEEWKEKGNRLISERAEAIEKSLREVFDSPVEVIMTTCDRTDLLKQTVEGWNSSSSFPYRVSVYDDCSQDNRGVRKLISLMQNATWVAGEEHLGCWDKTPDALRTEFNSGAEAVFIVDSDTAFSAMWWHRVRTMYPVLKKREDFGFFSLFNQASIPGEPDPEMPSMLRKRAVGAFGCLVTKESFEKYIKPYAFTEAPVSNWDNVMCRKAIEDGKVVFCSSPSFLQHIGYSRGTHPDGAMSNPTIAEDFIGMTLETYTDCRNKHAKGTKKVLFSLPARKGDIIAGSMIANQLKDMGYHVTWLVIRGNVPLVNFVAPTIATQIVDAVGQHTDWGYMDTWQMKEAFPGYEFYINAQFGSPENHYHYLNSHMKPLDWLRERIQKIIGEPLSDQYAQYLRLTYEKDVIASTGLLELRPEDKLVIIAPEAITSKALTDEEAERLFEMYRDEGYVVRMLIPELPNDITYREARDKYLWHLSFEDCIYILKRTDFFIGNDSGLAWASLYSPDCKKIIYHEKKRIDEVNTYFNALDKNAKDIII